MRPTTLAQACRRAQAGEPFTRAFAMAIGDFLQAYYTAPGPAAREPMLHDEPPPFADPRYDALVGGMAEYLYKRWAPFRPPPWIKNANRYLDRPFWPVGEGDPALMEYLVFASPGEFRDRNVMTDEAPLRRACQPPVEPLNRSEDDASGSTAGSRRLVFPGRATREPGTHDNDVVVKAAPFQSALSWIPGSPSAPRKDGD